MSERACAAPRAPHWTNFRLCFAAAPYGVVRRLAGWVCYHDGSWWVKRHDCKAATSTGLAISTEAGTETVPWIRAQTREGCVRYLARATLLDLKHDPSDGAADPSWPKHVKERAQFALKLGGRIIECR
jgi:hypothetical protein